MSFRNRLVRGSPQASPADGLNRVRVWRLALVVGLLGVLITATVTWWMWDRARAETVESLANEGQQLADSVETALDEVVERLVGVGSFYQASGDVTQEGFRRYIANFNAIPGMGGIGFMRIVLSEDLAEFEAEMRATIPDYTVFEFDEEGNRVPVEPRSFHVPAQWFEPAEAFGRPHGFDSASEATRRSALIRARVEKEEAVTPFLRLVSEGDDDGFLIYWPVTDPVTNEVFGFTFAPMDLSELLDGQLDESVSDDLTWEIEVLSAGRRPQAPERDTWTTVIDVGSVWWTITAASTDAGGFEPTRTEINIVLMAVTGLATTILAAGGIHQYRRKEETQKELEQLRKLTRSKDQFLASVSHELRTPLTGVLGFAELLRDDQQELTEAERRSMIANVAEEAGDLAAIIDDLLVSARSELDLLVITRVPVSFRAQVAQVLESTHVSIRDRVEVVGDTRQTALGDPGRVRQIIRNLITNASRYGGDRIEVRFSVGDGMVRLEVADNGPGLASQEWERIFEPYYRAHQNDGTQPAALGIGLSVARHLARLMEGELSYRREAGWSVFRLALPGVPVATRQEVEELESATS